MIFTLCNDVPNVHCLLRIFLRILRKNARAAGSPEVYQMYQKYQKCAGGRGFGVEVEDDKSAIAPRSRA